MKHHDHYHCDECAAEFANEQLLQQHRSERHQPDEAKQATPPHGDELKPRQNRVFTRSHRE
jgi:hypothetical protein